MDILQATFAVRLAGRMPSSASRPSPQACWQVGEIEIAGQQRLFQGGSAGSRGRDR